MINELEPPFLGRALTTAIRPVLGARAIVILVVCYLGPGLHWGFVMYLALLAWLAGWEWALLWFAVYVPLFAGRVWCVAKAMAHPSDSPVHYKQAIRAAVLICVEFALLSQFVWEVESGLNRHDQTALSGRAFVPIGIFLSQFVVTLYLAISSRRRHLA